MLLRRLVGDLVYDLVVDADGPVRQAILETGECIVTNDAIGGSKAIYKIDDHRSAKEDWSGGAIGGDIDTLRPRVYFPKGHKPSEVLSQEYAAGQTQFVENVGTSRLYSFATGALVTTIPRAPEDQGLMYVEYQFKGEDLFWTASAMARTLIKVRTAAGEIRTLIGHGDDTSRAADAFGTDGVDMVWVEASGRTNTTTTIYPMYETWTAKYTTDPAVLEATKRRVRSTDGTSFLMRYAVGCGYAVAAISPKMAWGNATGFRLTRLSDGMSWEVLAESERQRTDVNLDNPIAVACDEVFVLGSTLSHYEVARVRIDSLGPGIPAD